MLLVKKLMRKKRRDFPSLLVGLAAGFAAGAGPGGFGASGAGGEDSGLFGVGSAMVLETCQGH
jgi:hypothetical protein